MSYLMERNSVFALRFKKKARMSPIIITSVLGFKPFNNTIRQSKEIKGVQIMKEDIKLSLFTDNMIIDVANKELTKKLLELISDVGKLAE